MARRGRYEFSEETKEFARKKASYRCERCGRKGTTEIHHKIPVRIAIKHEFPYLAISSLANCEVLCPNCHKEADQEVYDWETFAQAVLGAIQLKMF